ncbi:hypothetical protein KAI19_03930 [bacterium]|nr:hypothetical protein [bacterium]
MPRTNLALKLKDFEEDYCSPYIVDNFYNTLPDNIVQFPISKTNDDINQLSGEVKADSAAQELYSYNYSFDAVGNRLNLNKNVAPSATNIPNPGFWDMPNSTYFNKGVNSL